MRETLSERLRDEVQIEVRPTALSFYAHCTPHRNAHALLNSSPMLSTMPTVIPCAFVKAMHSLHGRPRFLITAAACSGL